MEQKHTPGPWIYGPEVGPDCTRIDAENGLVIAAVRSREITSWEQSRPIYSWSEEGAANARLIAAAPELLDELIEQDKFLGVLAGTVPLSEKDTHRRIAMHRESVRAAIAKATGQ